MNCLIYTKDLHVFFCNIMIIDKKLLEKYIRGEATPEERETAFQWISAHPDHHSRYLLDKRLYEMSIYQGDREFGKRREHGRVLLFRILRYAAVACAVIGAFFLRDFWDRTDDKPVMQTISVPAGQRSSVTLSDGTNIELGSNTKLVFPATFEKHERRVHLAGSAYFHVAENRKKPFFVISEQGTVQVTGTTFYVDAIPRYDIFKTSLLEGEVKIHPMENPENVITLRPGQQGILNDGKLTVQPIADYDEFLWRDGLIAFKNKTLAEIFFQLQTVYDISIVFKNRPLSTRQQTYSGKFYQMDGIDYALRILQEKVRFRYERDEEKRIIYIL